MKQLNLPTKPLNTARIWICLALTLLMLIFSICPIISVNLKDNKISQSLQNAMDRLNEDAITKIDFQIPESVSVTMPKLVRVDIFVTRTIAVFIKTAKNPELEEEEFAKLRELLKDPKYQEAFLMVIATSVDIIDFDKISNNETDVSAGSNTDSDTDSGENSEAPATNEKSEGSTIGTIIMIVVRVIVLLSLAVMITAMPIILFFNLLFGLISALRNLDYPEKVASKIGAKLMKGIDAAIFTALMLTLFRGLEFGYGLKWIFACSVVGAVINLVSTRLRSYEASDFRFVNIIQGSCVFTLIFGVVFFSNVLKIGVFSGFFEALGSYMEKLELNVKVVNNAISLFNSVTEGAKVDQLKADYMWLIDIFIMLFFVTFVISGCAALIIGSANKLCLTQRKKDRGLIFNGIICTITAALPFVVSNLKNAKEYDLEITGDTAKVVITSSPIYQLPDSSKNALIVMLVCGILTFATGIVINVLKRKFCPEMSVEYQNLILGGNTPEFASKTNHQTAAAASEQSESSVNDEATRT